MDFLGHRPGSSPAPRPLPGRQPRGGLHSRCALPLLLAVILAGLPAAAGARPLAKDWRIEPFEWHGSLAAGRVLTVRNPYGDVRARRSNGTSASVHAAMQRHRDDPREWKISVAETADGLAVEVVPAPGKVPAGAAADWGLRRVDLTVYVPAGARLRAETTAGLIEAKRLGSDVHARSAGGEIVVTTSGSVDARSEQGRIRYSFLDPQWAGSARLATRSGEVIVILPKRSNVALKVRTRGEISADGLPAPGGGPPRAGPKHHEFQRVIGTGASVVAVESESGKVEIRQNRS